MYTTINSWELSVNVLVECLKYIEIVVIKFYIVFIQTLLCHKNVMKNVDKISNKYFFTKEKCINLQRIPLHLSRKYKYNLIYSK